MEVTTEKIKSIRTEAGKFISEYSERNKRSEPREKETTEKDLDDPEAWWHVPVRGGIGGTGVLRLALAT